ncbi:MAG: alpha/beta hydrolase [Desulfopila sp.]
MQKHHFQFVLSWCLMVLLSCSLAHAYDYPITDRYAATVLATPPEYVAPLPAKIPTTIDSITMFKGRKVPAVLWNMDTLYYSYLRQKGPAPLIFLIAGTGSSFKSGKMTVMQKAFYQAGFNVISLSSSTHPNFVVSGSTTGVPGDLESDGEDLYRIMQAIYDKLKDTMQVTRFYLSGYSLGAAQSAFVAHIDEREKIFNFDKVLLINPPVSLYNSVVILDDMLRDNIPGGMDNFDEFYQQMVKAFGQAYANGDRIEFNDEFLYEAYKYHKPISATTLKALIGVSFRVSCQNMAFASDVMTRSGYVVSKDLQLGRFALLEPYNKVLAKLTFLDYFDGIFVPHFQVARPGMSRDEMLEKMSLHPIENYLRTSPKFGLITNEDDIILLPGEIDYLRDLFGSRATIYPHGGHCGNMAYRDNVAAMVGFFQNNKQN